MRHWFVLLALAAAVGCADLPALERGSCGNGIVEPALGEDCDGPGDDTCGAATDPVRACRWLCAADDGEACPAGLGCGDDGICRAGTATFAASSARSWVAGDTLVVDVNGDGALDLVGLSSQRIDLALGTAAGDLAATTTAAGPYVTGAPAVGDPTGDGLPDLIVPTPVGVVTLAGDALEGLVPVAQSSFDVDVDGPLGYRVIEVGGGSTLASVANGLPGRGVLVNDDSPSGRQVVPFPVGHTVDNIVGDELLYTVRLNPQLALEGVLIVPFADGLWMVRVTPAVVGDEVRLSFTELGMVMMPDPTVCGPLRWAGLHTVDDVAGADLELITQTASGRSCIYAMLAVPVRDDQPVRGFAGTAPVRVWQEPVIGPGAEPVAPLALDDRQATTWFIAGSLVPVRYSLLATRRDVRMLACGATGVDSCELSPPLRTHSRDWDHAAFLELGQANLTDELVGWRLGEAGLDLFVPVLGDALPRLNDIGLATVAPVLGVTTGDFDGDTIPDLAIATGERVVGVEPDDDAVYISFSQATGVPSTPVLAGRFGHLIAMAPVDLPVALELDAVDDLLVVAERGFDGAAAIRGGAVLLGSTSRRLVAPLILPAADPPQVAVALAPLHLDSRPGEDLIVLTKTGSRYAALPYSPDGFSMDLLTETPISFAAAFSLEGSQWVTVANQGARRIAAGADLQGRVAVVAFDCPSTCTATPQIRTIAPAAGLGAVSSLRAVDLDGDGDLDLLGVFGARARTSTTVALWRNDGSLPEQPTVVLTLDGVLFDATAADIDHNGRVDLLIAGRPGVLRAEADGWTWPDPTPLVTRFDDAPVVWIDAPDLDRDGLPDLIVAEGSDRRHPTALTVMRQLEARAGAVEAQ